MSAASASDLKLRPAVSADWDAVRALLQAHALPLEGAREHLADYLLAECGGEVAGCAGLEVYGDVALLRSVAVAPGLKGQGVGGALVTALIAEAARRGLRGLYLLSVTAPDYFLRHGFARLAADQAPDALRASAEFRGACPASAVLMGKDLAV